jgi:hypothetical protein
MNPTHAVHMKSPQKHCESFELSERCFFRVLARFSKVQN